MFRNFSPAPMAPARMFRAGVLLFVAGLLVKFLIAGGGGWITLWDQNAWLIFPAQLLLTGVTEVGVGLVVGSFVLAALQAGRQSDAEASQRR